MLSVDWSNAFCVRLVTYCCECGFAGALYKVDLLQYGGGNLITWLPQLQGRAQYLILILILISHPYPYLPRACAWARHRWAGLLMVPRGRETPRGFKAYRGETAHLCRNALQALLGFFIALLGAVSLDDRIVCRIYFCGWGTFVGVRPVFGTGPTNNNCIVIR